MNPSSSPRALFVGTTYAGWKTRQMNLETHVAADGRLDARFARISGWREGGVIERLPLPGPVRGRLRALAEARSFASFPRPDITWTSCSELALPFMWAQAGPWRRPLIMETDWTLEQQEAFAPLYFGREPRTGARMKLAAAQERLFFRHVTLFAPWSNWAADGLRRVGVDDGRIHVLHPGLNLDAWTAPRREAPVGRPLRLLFVGGDFARKGGPMLVALLAGQFRGRAELDIVTRDDVVPAPGVRVHRAEVNSPALKALYASADLFVLPTLAEAFGLATVEAMASGLPCIVANVGGAPDIVHDGVTGWLIQPNAVALAEGLERAIAQADRLPAMGARGRKRAEERFDGARNDRLLVELMLECVARRERTKTPVPEVAA